MSNLRTHRAYCVIGRIATALALWAVAVFTLLHFADTAASWSAAGLSMARFWLGVSVAVELVCGACLLVGWRTRSAALTATAWFGLAIVARLLLLGLNRGGGFELLSGQSFLVRDGAIIASLLMAAGHGAGPLSLDERHRPVTSLGDSNVLG